ncbi:MAG: hypothetical protein Q8K97_12475 [Pseudohongiella sp.]|nr:hypothetical protein [Pseudohongiella sp.]
MAGLVGSDPDQLPTNGDLGDMAKQSSNAVVLRPQAGVTPHAPGDMVFQLSDNETLVIKVKGLDGVVRSTEFLLEE